MNPERFFIAFHRRCGGDAGEDEDVVYFRPIRVGGSLGDGGVVRGVIELCGEGGGDEGVRRDMLGGGEAAGLAGGRFGKFDVERHGVGITSDRMNQREGKVNDRVYQFGWLARFGDEFEVADVLPDGCALGMVMDQTGKRFACSLPVLGECLETNIARENHATMRARELQQSLF